MNLIGLITEYNPFHNGHAYHLHRAKEKTGADGTVVVMSGNFVQRGTPAIFNKWMRTEMALQGGADLVLELPAIYATASAEIFALGAVRVLSGLGCINEIVFGSESGEMAGLEDVAHLLHKESDAFKEVLKHELSKGYPFPKAREKALREHFSVHNLPSLPNDILGIEYIKAGLRTNAKVRFNTIKRLESQYHDTDVQKKLSSATAVRKAFFEGRVKEAKSAVPAATYDMLLNKGQRAVSPEALYPLLMYKLRTESHLRLSEIQDMSEGLEHRILDAAQRASSYTDLVDRVKTKRYVRTRIQRVLLNTLLGIDSTFMKAITHDEGAVYARVLGFNDTGRSIMKHMRKVSQIPVITNVNKCSLSQANAEKMLSLDFRATDVYSILDQSYAGAQDKLIKPIYLR